MVSMPENTALTSSQIKDLRFAAKKGSSLLAMVRYLARDLID